MLKDVRKKRKEEKQDGGKTGKSQQHSCGFKSDLLTLVTQVFLYPCLVIIITMAKSPSIGNELKLVFHLFCVILFFFDVFVS